jgi:carboxypeptidase family protein
MVCTALLTLALSAPRAQSPETSGRIIGRVTAADTNFPLDNAMVSLVRLPAGDPPARPFVTALTDPDGRFVFAHVAAGAYYVDVRRTGYAPLDQPASDARTTVDVVARTVTELALTLRKGGAINGRVLDDLDDFRLSGLAPGTYYVVAVPRAAVPVDAVGALPPSGLARTTTATTFYPGTADQRSAAPIPITGSADVRDIVITMQPVPAFRVSGVVVDEHGAPVPRAVVVLTADPNSGVVPGPPNAVETTADGQFTIGEVTAGRYRIFGGIPGMVSRPNDPIPPPTEVVVTNADLVGVRVVTTHRD